MHWRSTLTRSSGSVEFEWSLPSVSSRHVNNEPGLSLSCQSTCVLVWLFYHPKNYILIFIILNSLFSKAVSLTESLHRLGYVSPRWYLAKEIQITQHACTNDTILQRCWYMVPVSIHYKICNIPATVRVYCDYISSTLNRYYLVLTIYPILSTTTITDHHCLSLMPGLTWLSKSFWQRL